MSDPLASLPAAAATTAATPTPAPAKGADIRQVAKQFEALFMRQMIGAMRQANLSDGLFDSSASDQFRDMADAKLADGMAGSGAGHGFGIADLLARQLGAKDGAGAPAAGQAKGSAG